MSELNPTVKLQQFSTHSFGYGIPYQLVRLLGLKKGQPAKVKILYHKDNDEFAIALFPQPLKGKGSKGTS